MASLKKFIERRRHPWKGIGYDGYAAFRKGWAQARLEHYPDLPDAPVVLDFGGYLGAWSDVVRAQHPNATIHVFEPHPKFAHDLTRKYANDGHVTVHAQALGSKDGTLSLPDAADGSSAVAAHQRNLSAQVRAVAGFFGDHELPQIDLAKINIEGGEYDLLPALIDSDVIARIARLQVQFHLFDESMIAMRDAVRQRLGITHDCVWCYPFVWEEWHLKPGA